MGDSTGSEDGAGSTREDCPRCGAPVSMVTSGGPLEHYASPCGCRLPAGGL
ncbi:hypothetical protein [Halomontanus rarus]|uniref:hypothetical protein n=1 Tax=Halomontanus rarus TaxID=3034020 RepID=UPI001A97E4DD